MKHLVTIIAITLAIGWLPPAASCATVEGVAFDAVRVEADQRLELRGAGLFRYMIFIKAYAGALYLPEEVPSRQALTDVPKRLEVAYFHAIQGEDFGPATIAGIRQNVDEATYKRIEPQIALHNSLYRDVRPGDRYALTYLPGRGTSLSLNGEVLGVIPGEEFASALFAIWIGASPISKNFKKSILGEG